MWHIAFSQQTEVEKYYVRADTLFISQLTEAYNTSTEELLKTLEVKNDRREDLGFGYQLKESGKGVGSTSFNYKILYYKNEVVAYELSTYIKANKSISLKNLYKERLSAMFKVSDDYEVEPIYSGIDRAGYPLDGAEKRTDNKLNKIMNPFAGIIFGNRCGIVMNILNNRELFNEIINTDNCEYLLYSINPATRLMTVEFYYCNLTEFSENQKNSIDLRIEELKKVPLLTRNCYGCNVGSELTEKTITELKNCR
ncbi:hypothetical protein AEQU3_02397 [Aequorivita antarctica]|uniref:Uncharacterized protein n=2 Tax=Aequorivita antarctica TaxID=153266 RepID=A0A5C6YWF5_9FLAO|nr:hypothetical protein ESU54_14675 [Aequorivita antarctica]SRX75403.1 hypothetical protein AEQU3_02397 [Aequorivita antarctica]